MKKTPNKQSFLFKQLCKALIVPLLVLAINYQKAAAQATVSNFIFKQYDRYDANGSLLFANSSLGSVSVSVVNPSSTQAYYLNVYAQSQSGANKLLVQNFPIRAKVNACQQIEVDYKYLDIYPGNPVYTVAYNYTVTSTVVATATSDVRDSVKYTAIGTNLTAGNAAAHTVPGDGVPNPNPGPGTTNATAYVVKEAYRNEASAAYNEFTNYASQRVTAPVVDTPIGHDVPPVQEGINDCLPGSFARSIAWLNTKYNLGINKTPKEIFDSLKAKMDRCSTSVPAADVHGCRLKAKADYLKALSGNRGTTTFTPVDTLHPVPLPGGLPTGPRPNNLNDWIKDKLKDCDVEMVYHWQPGDGTWPSHAITITHIQCGTDGCCTIWYRDDDTQGVDSTGDKCEKSFKLCNGKDTFSVGGSNKKIWYVVAECVTPAGGKVTTSPEPIAAPITLLQNTPNPFGSSTTIGIKVEEGTKTGVAQLIIRNAHGNEIQRIRLNLKPGLNNIPYQRSRDAKGLLYYSLQVDGQTIATRQMMTELQ